ncbi:MAG: hypothetical protein KC547_22355, partial [Anaerolineae bacterium]|nr:hypothetical protein [Anaerolineae bacterium]
MMMYERLVQWAADLWETRFPGQRFVTLRAAVECGNMIAHSQVKAGRKLRGKARYTGYEEIECPVI